MIFTKRGDVDANYSLDTYEGYDAKIISSIMYQGLSITSTVKVLQYVGISFTRLNSARTFNSNE